MKYLPIFMNIRERECLVVGGGEIATRKVALLHEAGAKVTVMAPQLSDTLTSWQDEGKISSKKKATEVVAVKKRASRSLRGIRDDRFMF